MANYTQEVYTVTHLDELALQATFYRPKTDHYLATILYFHGGGFVFGEREDLPASYLDLLTEAGYGLISFDYPLAPEVILPIILSKTEDCIDWFLSEGIEELQLPTNDYYLMGRSAGAYLALYNADRQVKADAAPRGVISFYGYYHLNDTSFHQPNPVYLKYPAISEAQVISMTQAHPIVNAPMHQRFPLYLALRQHGNWMRRLLDDSADAQAYSLSQVDLAQLPRTFVAAALGDPDVPYRISKQMSELIPDSTLVTIKSDEHDFDRTSADTHGRRAYRKLLRWLKADQK